MNFNYKNIIEMNDEENFEIIEGPEEVEDQEVYQSKITSYRMKHQK